LSEILPEDWLRCQLTVERGAAEIGSNWLLDQGCQGVQIEDTVVVFDQSEDAQLVERDEVVLTGYLRGAAPEQAAILAAERPFAGALEVTRVETRDWANEWRENFPPLWIGPFLVVPTWEEIPDPGTETKWILRLDPGLAFGTGQHPTTQLCLELLAAALENSAGLRVLDVGCGSGILSIAAAKLGAEVTGSDLDPWCIQATEENAGINEVKVNVVEAADLNWAREPFPLVIANLMSDLLIRLAPDLARVTAPGGRLIISGISLQRADEVETAIAAAGFVRHQKREMEGEARGDWVEWWAAFVFDRP